MSKEQQLTMSLPRRNVDEAAKQRDKGVESVTHNAGGFVEQMRGEAVRIARERGTVTADDVREVAERLGIAPHHPNAWGAIFRGKGFAVAGYTHSVYVSNHRRRIPIWRLVHV